MTGRLASEPGDDELRDMQREARALEQRVEQRIKRADERERRAQLTVIEGGIYSKRSPNSYFADISRVATGYGDVTGAKERLDFHEAQLAATYPAWREARIRQAHQAYEAAFGGDRRGQEKLERMDRAGLARFVTDDAFASTMLEQRAANTTQGTGGYFAPPLWLMDDWAQAPRAGRPFADLWRGLPLPLGCRTVNVPKWTTGIGSGPDTDGSSVPSDTPADSFSTSNVVTIAGSQLVSMQYAEQTAPPGYDAFIFADIMADIGAGLDAQLLIGSGTGGQLNGAIIAGTAAAANHVLVANSNAVASQSITVTSAGSPVYRSATRLAALMASARGLGPSHYVLHPSTYYQLAGQIDSTGKPLVPLSASPPVSGDQVTAFGGTALLDDNLPVTFGGATAPTVSTTGGGVTNVTAGNGTWAVIAAVRAADLFLFEGELRIQVAIDQAGASSGQWRFVCHQYAAALRDRYVAASSLSAAAESDAGSVTAGGSTSIGVATHYQANSPLQPHGQGFAF